MAGRLMELICMFDLPVLTAGQRRAYRRFHRLLEDFGFTMLEESVYCRMAPSGHPLETLKADLRKQAPKEGIVTLLTVTERQFENMDFITGDWKSDVVASKESVVEL